MRIKKSISAQLARHDHKLIYGNYKAIKEKSLKDQKVERIYTKLMEILEKYKCVI